MLKAPKMAGPAQLRMLLDDVPAARHGELLGVSARTLRRWLAGETEIPQSAFQALFWHTRWGVSVIESEYGFDNQILRLQVQAGAGLCNTAGHVGGKAHTPAANGDEKSPRAGGLQLVASSL